MSQWRQFVMPLLRAGRAPARRGGVGVAIIVVVFVGAAALGIAVASQHHGLGPTARTFEVSITAGHMTPSHLSVRAGDQVVLAITGDTSETVVLEGYQEQFTLIPGLAVDATFVAAKVGTFDFVVQGSKTKLGDLTVTG